MKRLKLIFRRLFRKPITIENGDTLKVTMKVTESTIYLDNLQFETKVRHKNIKSADPNIRGHSIRNIHIKHLLMHEGNDIRYVCISSCGTTPEKSTWKLEEVTCKNCLHQLKTILHKIDWRGKRKAIYDGQLWDERFDKDCLTDFCTECVGKNNIGNCMGLCHIDGQCPYHTLMNKMHNDMRDYL